MQTVLSLDSMVYHECSKISDWKLGQPLLYTTLSEEWRHSRRVWTGWERQLGAKDNWWMQEDNHGVDCSTHLYLVYPPAGSYFSCGNMLQGLTTFSTPAPEMHNQIF